MSRFHQCPTVVLHPSSTDQGIIAIRSIACSRSRGYSACMNLDHDRNFRSPLLLDKSTSFLVVVDVQEKLVPLIKGDSFLIWNLGRVIDSAGIMGVPVRATEQYPKGLGRTVESLQKKLQASGAGSTLEKTMFSCRECLELFEAAESQQRHQIVLTGIETHVCVLQTAFDFLAAGFDVYLIVDAVGSRSKRDHRIALNRLETAGVNLVSAESVMFEWCEVSDTPEFKQISELVKLQPPPRKQRIRRID